MVYGHAGSEHVPPFERNIKASGALLSSSGKCLAFSSDTKTKESEYRKLYRKKEQKWYYTNENQIRECNGPTRIDV